MKAKVLSSVFLSYCRFFSFFFLEMEIRENSSFWTLVSGIEQKVKI